MLVGDQESTDVAFEYFARAIEIDPTLTEAHVGLGAVYDARFWSGWGGGLRNLDLARSSYEDALRLNPANMRARRGLMSVHFSFGDSEACLRQGQEAARLGRPDDVETLLARGEAFYRGGLHDLALPLLGRVIALDPGNEPRIGGPSSPHTPPGSPTQPWTSVTATVVDSATICLYTPSSRRLSRD